MKYIVVELDGKETIFIFPDMVIHKFMAEALEYIRFGDDHNWNRRISTQGNLISAGFIVDGVCTGHSESLGLKSRGQQDTALLSGATPLIVDGLVSPEGEMTARLQFESAYKMHKKGNDKFTLPRGRDGKYLSHEAETGWQMFIWGCHYGSR